MATKKAPAKKAAPAKKPAPQKTALKKNELQVIAFMKEKNAAIQKDGDDDFFFWDGKNIMLPPSINVTQKIIDTFLNNKLVSEKMIKDEGGQIFMYELTKLG